MAVNIKAVRRVSLDGFGVGWDDCYLIVKALPDEEASAIGQKVDEAEEAKDEIALRTTLREFALENIVRGAILNTGEDGKEERYEFGADEVPDVVSALGLPWQIHALSIASGSDRLKSQAN